MSCKIVQGYVITPIELGKGCFGTVYRGYVKDNKNELLAVKTIPLESIKNEEIVRRQIQILLKLKSPNIVKYALNYLRFYKPAKTAKHLYFFLEYCQQDLKSYVKSKGGKLSEAEVQNILMQICKGFQVVHENNIIHRDVKPANFLIHNGIIKISDFGFARSVDNLDQPLYLTFLGSPLYMAPQILGKEKFSSKCDIWSLGVTIYQILYGKTPFTAQNPKQLLDNIRNKPLLFPENIKRSEQIKDLLRRMLTIEEDKRISWAQLFSHPYIYPKIDQEPNQCSDSLMRSFASNNTYMTRNKVVVKTSVSPSVSQIAETNKIQKKSQKENEINFNKELQEQNNQINQYLKIEEIDEFIRYKRNVSVFLNVQCNNYFTYANENLPQIMFHAGLFLLLSHQIKIHNQLKEELHSQKPSMKLLQLQTWTSYLKSPCFNRIIKLVECDLKHLQSYFYQVRNRVDIGFKNASNKVKYGEFMEIFEKYYANSKDKHNEEAYEFTMKFIIRQLMKSQKKISDKLFSVKLLMTIRPFKYLNQKMDFGLFYEHQSQEIDKLKIEFPQLSQFQ